MRKYHTRLSTQMPSQITGSLKNSQAVCCCESSFCDKAQNVQCGIRAEEMGPKVDAKVNLPMQMLRRIIQWFCGMNKITLNATVTRSYMEINIKCVTKITEITWNIKARNCSKLLSVKKCGNDYAYMHRYTAPPWDHTLPCLPFDSMPRKYLKL